MRIAICASGAGGHIYPAISIMEEIKGDVIFFCKKGVEHPIQRRVKTIFLDIKKTPISMKNNILLCNKIMKEFRPRKLLAMGGYVCIPPLIVALVRRIPFILHEQNVFPGRTNRLFGFFAEAVAVSFPPALHYFPKKKVHLVGNPVNKKICTIKKEEARSILGLDKKKKTVLVFGGSLGAASLNEAIIKTLNTFAHLEKEVQFLIITGRRYYNQMKEKIDSIKIKTLLFPYVTQMHVVYAASDLVVCRAGGMSLSEIAKCKKPSIIIPYPHATDDHQRKNAYFFKEKGAAKVLEDKDLHKLPSLLEETLMDEKSLLSMSKKVASIYIEDATERMLSLLFS